MDAECTHCTHEENVAGIVTQREIKEKNVWQADLLPGISLKKELCICCGGRQVGREMRWAGRGGTGRQRMVEPCSTALPSCQHPASLGEHCPACAQHTDCKTPFVSSTAWLCLSFCHEGHFMMLNYT